MITVRNLRYRALSIDDLLIGNGVTSVIGPNGSGKTTFLKLLAGIILPETGSVTICGKNPRDTEIGWAGEFPDRNILFGTVSDEVSSPLRFRHLPCNEVVHRAGTAMASAGLTPLATRPVRELSGGEKVLTALAAALVARPEVLILDEYDSHLDAGRAGQIDDLLRKSRIPFVIHCTQDTEAAARSDRILFFEQGRVSLAGSPETVFASLRKTPYFPLSWRCRT